MSGYVQEYFHEFMYLTWWYIQYRSRTRRQSAISIQIEKPYKEHLYLTVTFVHHHASGQTSARCRDQGPESERFTSAIRRQVRRLLVAFTSLRSHHLTQESRLAS